MRAVGLAYGADALTWLPRSRPRPEGRGFAVRLAADAVFEHAAPVMRVAHDALNVAARAAMMATPAMSMSMAMAAVILHGLEAGPAPTLRGGWRGGGECRKRQTGGGDSDLAEAAAETGKGHGHPPVFGAPVGLLGRCLFVSGAA